MNKTGYGILLVVMLGLGIYAFHPESVQSDSVLMLTTELPNSFHLHVAGLNQDVTGMDDHLHGLVRPLDAARTRALWQYFKQPVPKAHIREHVDDSQLAAFGIDGSSELSAPGIQLRWGAIDGNGYVWNGMTKEIFEIGGKSVQRLHALAGRLDKEQLLDVDSIQRLNIEQGLFSTTVVRQDSEHWQDTIRRERLIPLSHVDDLLVLMGAVRLQDFVRTAPDGVPDIGVVRIGQKGLLGAEHTVRVWHTVGGALVQVDDFPVQLQGEQAAKSWDRVITELGRDYLFDLRHIFERKALSEVLIVNSPTHHFRLEKHGMRDVVNGLSQWDVVWPNGREIARSVCAADLAHAFDQMVVMGVQLRGDAKVPAGAMSVDFVFQVDSSHILISISGAAGDWTVWSDTHYGHIAQLPVELAHLSPDGMFDLGMVNRPAQQVVKLQRIISDPRIIPNQSTQQRETYVLGDDHVWKQTFPVDQSARLIDANAIDRLSRALCVAQAHSVRFITPEDRAILSAPDFELDLRFDQIENAPSVDASRLDETTSQDMGFCFKRAGPQRWRAVDKEGAVSYLVDSDLVDLLLASVSDTLVLPLVPSLVTRIYVTGQKERYELDLTPGAGGWVAMRYDEHGKIGAPKKADPIQVRRLLRALANVRASRIDIHAAPLRAAEADTIIRCTLPGRENERQTLTIGKHLSDTDDWVLSAESDHSTNGHGPAGRCYLPANQTPIIKELTPTFASLLALPEPAVTR